VTGRRPDGAERGGVDVTRFAAIGYGREPRAPYACDPAASRGRLHPEPVSPTRTEFQRDRDRIIHSTAFRRLAHKTQVFLYHEGDHFRTRLTHTIEVAQIARGLARALRLDEDLAEALALGHDLGHTPFGHAGERALDRAMAAFGGFDHNDQTLKIVTDLERRYAGFDGLNLTWETLEGLVKHNGPLIDPDGGRHREVSNWPDGAAHALAHLPPCIAAYQARHDLQLAGRAGLEAQLAALADDIAYDAHDIDDGLRAHLIDVEQLRPLPLVGAALAEVERRHPGLDHARQVQEITRRLITAMVEDVIAETSARLAALEPGSADDIRAAADQTAAFSPAVAAADRAIKNFLFASVYRSEPVMRVMRSAEQVVEDLHRLYLAEPDRLPAEWRRDLDPADRGRVARRAADYIAGMTDRFALMEHDRQFDRRVELR
jgi:dGTPase